MADPPGVVFELPRSLELERDGQVTVRLQNQRAVAGNVVLSVFLASEHGSQRLDDFLSLDLPASGSVTVSLPLARLNLPAQPLTIPGHVNLDASLSYTDGFTQRLSAQPLYLQPSGQRWRVYDRSERAKLPAGGALTPELRAALEPMLRTRPNLEVVPAYAASEAEVLATAASDGSSLPTDVPPPYDEEAAIHAAQRFLRLPATPSFTHEGMAEAIPSDSAQPQFHLTTNVLPHTGTLCVRMTTNYTDVGGAGGAVPCADNDGTCEDDYTVAGNVNRMITGMYFELIPSGSPSAVASGYLGDGFPGRPQGCTPALTLAHGTYVMNVWTLGSVGGSLFAVSDEIISDYDVVGITIPSVSWPDSDGLVTAVPAFFNAAQPAFPAIAYALGQNLPLVPFPAFHFIHIKDTGANTTFTDCDDGEVWIGRDFSKNKFLMAHELGHAVQDTSVGGGCAFLASYEDTGGGNCASSSGNHHWRSREFMSSAHTEGFANFYAAASFNKRLTAADCWVVIMPMAWWEDCEFSETTPTPWMDSSCPAPLSGRGAEIDWTRQFWDVRTNSSSSPWVSAMLRWIEDANDSTAWSTTNHYMLLDAEANDTATHGSILNSVWDTNKTTNGIVH